VIVIDLKTCPRNDLLYVDLDVKPYHLKNSSPFVPYIPDLLLITDLLQLHSPNSTCKNLIKALLTYLLTCLLTYLLNTI